MPKVQKHHPSIIGLLMPIIFFFFMVVGLAAGVIIAQDSQDVRNQAWQGRMIEKMKDKWTKSVVVGDCDPTNFQTVCQNDVLSYCTNSGKQLQVKCGENNAVCGTVPAGQNKGQPACIPNEADDFSRYYSQEILSRAVTETGECQADTYRSSCSGNKATRCTEAGKQIQVDCATLEADCAVLPVGQQKGTAVCVPQQYSGLPVGI